MISVLKPISQKSHHEVRYGGSDVAAFHLNCKITKRLVHIDPKFKNRRLCSTLQKRSKGNLEKHFALVRTI